MIKVKDGDFFISDWLRNRNTVEFLGIWERVYNPAFNYGEYAIIRNQAGLNSYKISVKECGSCALILTKHNLISIMTMFLLMKKALININQRTLRHWCPDFRIIKIRNNGKIVKSFFAEWMNSCAEKSSEILKPVLES